SLSVGNTGRGGFYQSTHFCQIPFDSLSVCACVCVCVCVCFRKLAIVDMKGCHHGRMEWASHTHTHTHTHTNHRRAPQTQTHLQRKREREREREKCVCIYSNC